MRRILLSAFVAWVALATIPPRFTAVQAQAPCGGEERWAVKVAADDDAGLIDTANPVATPLHDLIALPRPDLPDDDVSRAPEERTVHAVDGRLLKFKLESGRTGDQDYHLVITDDTLLFSPGGSNTQPVPHSFVAEIVNPRCVGGRHGTVLNPSRFATQLQAVYDKFNAQFTNITGGWNDAAAIPVRITGVGFFDRPHGQTGRAMNGLEIHPVLDIEFNPLAPVSPLPPVVVVRNPDFESGPQGWTASANVISTDPREPARNGQWKAWLGGYGTPHTDTLWQQVTLPSAAQVQSVTLEFYLHISTEEQALEAFDRLRVRLRRSNGQIITTLRAYSNLQAEPGYSRQTFNLTAYRGQTIRIELSAQEDNGSMTSFVLDDFRIILE